MILEISGSFIKGFVAGFMFGGIFWFPLGAIAFILIIVFPKWKRNFEIFEHIYKKWTDIKKVFKLR